MATSALLTGPVMSCGFARWILQVLRFSCKSPAIQMFVSRPSKLNWRGIIHRSHIQTNHLRPPPRRYYCGTCATHLGFTQKQGFIRHLREHSTHLNEAYTCCQQRIKCRYDFKKHTEQHIKLEYHPVKAPPVCVRGDFVDGESLLELHVMLYHVDGCERKRCGRPGMKTAGVQKVDIVKRMSSLDFRRKRAGRFCVAHEKS